jgi:2-oxoglutarate dehydrogenase E2 component (dihydrolipoamide succinyltransferase)
VARDEQIATIETDKIDVQVNSTEPGTVQELFYKEGDTVSVGSELFKIDMDGKDTSPPPSEKAAKIESPAVKNIVPESANSNNSVPPPVIHSKPAENAVIEPALTSSLKPALKFAAKPASKPAPQQIVEEDYMPGLSIGPRTERLVICLHNNQVKMNRMRLKIAERLKESQTIAASLTTFNEIDMSALMALRKKYKEDVLSKHGVKLGYILISDCRFMGAFLKASSIALREVPGVNARIEGEVILKYSTRILFILTSVMCQLQCRLQRVLLLQSSETQKPCQSSI